jgi:hypothetical protein
MRARSDQVRFSGVSKRPNFLRHLTAFHDERILGREGDRALDRMGTEDLDLHLYHSPITDDLVDEGRRRIEPGQSKRHCFAMPVA